MDMKKIMFEQDEEKVKQIIADITDSSVPENSEEDYTVEDESEIDWTTL